MDNLSHSDSDDAWHFSDDQCLNYQSLVAQERTFLQRIGTYTKKAPDNLQPKSLSAENAAPEPDPSLPQIDVMESDPSLPQIDMAEPDPSLPQIDMAEPDPSLPQIDMAGQIPAFRKSTWRNQIPRSRKLT